jgi:trehalose 6-phosphate synthase
MRLLSARLIISLVVGITVISVVFSYYQAIGERRSLRGDLERRADVLGESLAGNIQRSWGPGSERELKTLVERFGNREHLLGVAIYDRSGGIIAITPGLEPVLPQTPSLVTDAIANDRREAAFTKVGSEPVHILALPLLRQNQVAGGLAVVQDTSYIHEQNVQVWRDGFLRVLTQVFFIVLITLLIIRWSIAGPIAQAAQWMRALRTGKITGKHELPNLDIFKPLAREVATMAESLSQARIAAENEARLRDAAESIWTAERLSVQVRTQLQGSRLVVVSNRQPYMHQRNGRSIEVIVPASGLVTGLEPILNACDGTWIAHGNGDADAEMVDQHDHLRVPPDDPRYTLRRVWLSKDEEEGYYYGFANEGLWPLCHIAHTRPIFRASDWQFYEEVNRKFADTVLKEIEEVANPVVLVQDYHFALLPRMIKDRRPDARVAIFWHIPWPNPEAFRICPWQRQLVDGLLGADLIGFHVQSHCNNFLYTADRTVESRVDWEHFSVLRHDHRTLVHPFPISVDVPDPEHDNQEGFSYEDRAALLRTLGVEATFLGIGVDRVDYTKGIIERFLAIEHFLESNPSYQGKFTFIQVGAPSRTHIKRYHDLLAEVESQAERINWRFQARKWKPILFLKRQHSHEEITKFYRAADLCLVTSLHDGMNLVAKEFLAARGDESGVLILSQFTGAARELRDALLINPYDIEQTAQAIQVALEMEPEEKRDRVQRMRKIIKGHNIYRWAGDLITELCEIRLDAPEDPGERANARATVA